MSTKRRALQSHSGRCEVELWRVCGFPQRGTKPLPSVEPIHNGSSELVCYQTGCCSSESGSSFRPAQRVRTIDGYRGFARGLMARTLEMDVCRLLKVRKSPDLQTVAFSEAFEMIKKMAVVALSVRVSRSHEGFASGYETSTGAVVGHRRDYVRLPWHRRDFRLYAQSSSPEIRPPSVHEVDQPLAHPAPYSIPLRCGEATPSCVAFENRRRCDYGRFLLRLAERVKSECAQKCHRSIGWNLNPGWRGWQV
jgi:hypothetical protein